MFVTGRLDDAVAAQAAAELMTLDASDDNPIDLYLDSPDGTLEAAFVLIDTHDLLRAPVRVHCQAGGPAIGVMAVADHRSASPHASLRLAEPTLQLSGATDQLALHSQQQQELLLEVPSSPRKCHGPVPRRDRARHAARTLPRRPGSPGVRTDRRDQRARAVAGQCSSAALSPAPWSGCWASSPLLTGGTVLLDEIGELASETSRLLSFLAQGEIRPVRSPASMLASSPPPTATWPAEREGRFREDLFCRLRRVVLTVPPLRAA